MLAKWWGHLFTQAGRTTSEQRIADFDATYRDCLRRWPHDPPPELEPSEGEQLRDAFKAAAKRAT
eukprot:12840986-Alexandrium_andersonii.AAC.1